jgi:hypothetical protein
MNKTNSTSGLDQARIKKQQDEAAAQKAEEQRKAYQKR